MTPLFRLGLKVLSRNKLSVFLFHKVPFKSPVLVPEDISIATFEFLLDTLMTEFRIIPYEDAVLGLQSGKLPDRAACITFDDGYADWLVGIAPALERRNMHATLFITVGQFYGLPLWHERISHAIKSTLARRIDLSFAPIPPLTLETLLDRQAAVAWLERDLKYLTVKARDDLVTRLETAAGVHSDAVTRMSVAQLRELHSRGFGIGAHTYNHPILDYCDENELVREIGGAREILSELIGNRVKAFAYPNGRPYVDFSSNHVNIVKQSGYTSAVTTQWGVAEVGSSVFQIPRFTPWGNDMLRIALQIGRNLLTKPTRVPESEA